MTIFFVFLDDDKTGAKGSVMDKAIMEFFHANPEDRKHMDNLVSARRYYEPFVHSSFLQYSISYLKTSGKYAFVAQIKVFAALQIVVKSRKRRVLFFNSGEIG